MPEIIQLGVRHYAIRSKSNIDWWYVVDDGVCTCRAAECGVKCWHLSAVDDYSSRAAQAKSPCSSADAIL